MRLRSLSLYSGVLFLIMGAETFALTPGQEAKIDSYLSYVLQDEFPQNLNQEAHQRLTLAGPDETTSPDQFPSDPSNGPLDPGYMDPYGYGNDGSLIARKNGSAELIAAKVFLETLKFYGVKHYMKKVGPQIEFKIISSKNSYFSTLTKLDVAYAIREFGRYLTAYMCGNANPENFYIMFNQIAEVGLRFKYDMAWALLGNSLPKEANGVYKLNTRWNAFSKILLETKMFKTDGGNSDDPNYSGPSMKPEMKSWISGMTDVVGIMTKLSALVCMTDLRPDPKLEIKKKVVVKKLLEIQSSMKKEYDQIKEMMDAVEKQAKSDQLNSLKSKS